jgi:lysophospholipase L1-like esterase
MIAVGKEWLAPARATGPLSVKESVIMLRASVVCGIICIVVLPCVGSERVTDPDPNRFAKEIEAFEQWDSKNAVPADPILFVGSSSIRMWRTHESFPGLPVINRGFGGSHISDVIHFADRIVLPYRPSLIVFYAGDNDVAGGKSAQRVLDDYRTFVTAARGGLPDVPIIFISIKPSGSRWALWPEMKRANDLIQGFCATDARLFFADLARPLLGPDGKPDSELFLDDRLHLNTRGYAAWTKTLMPSIREALRAEP